MYSETFTEDFRLCAGEKEKKSMPPGMMGNSVNFYSETYRKPGADCRNGGDEEEFPLNPALQAENVSGDTVDSAGVFKNLLE